MTLGDADGDLTDLAEGALSGPDWEAWRATHPEQAAEVGAARPSAARGTARCSGRPAG